MKSGMIRQILALILAMMMIAGMLPAAFASDEAGYVVQGDGAAVQPVPEAGSGETKETSDKTEETETDSVTVYRAFEVSLQKDGEDLDVEGEFRVTVDTGLDAGSLVPEGAERTGVSYTLYHIHGDQVDIIKDAEVDENGILTFTTPNFSTFVLQYTVDFAFEAEDGTVYEFSIPGGGCISLYRLAEELGLAEDDPQTEEDEVQAFIDNIEDVTFSSPDLVFIGKAEAYFTVGNIKEGVGLECTYSEELTEDDIAAINSQIIKSGDWAVISLEPFTSNETLTITMKDGKTYTVQVTDAQIKKTVISDSGDTWEITVTYGDDARIPDGSELRVIEIKEDDDEYSNVREELKTRLDEESKKIPSNPVLFDISIWNGNQKIEPAEGSKVLVEVKFIGNSIKGMYTDDDSPVLINDKPIADKQSEIEKQVQVLHLTENDQIDVVETEDTISSEEVVSSFTTDSFSNWLLYLDEDLTSIAVTTGDSITLRPYSEWIWKSEYETTYSGGQWVFPDEDWNTWTGEEGGVTYTYYEHKTNHSRFRSFEKTDDQLGETYTVVTSVWLNEGEGEPLDPLDSDSSRFAFDLQTNKGKIIHVYIKQGTGNDKPETVQGTGLTVNLFDYDVLYENGQPNFARSGSLDEQGNVASNPYNSSINYNHNLKFLGYGGGNDNSGATWINNYHNAAPTQNIVKNRLVNGYPELNDGSNQNLGYLFDTTSQNSNVYAFPNVSRLFQMDNLGYYFYNSNANYAEYGTDPENPNSFVLYEHTYSQNTGGSDGANAKPIGFFPFHEYDTVHTQPNMNFNKDLNHHFGMSLIMDFEIPKDRRAADPSGLKHDIIYEFSGDDDLWVFVDDKLVLDIGGIHQPVTGTINFTTGDVVIQEIPGTMNLLDDPAFAVGTHTFKMFYIERGGCDSNLSVRFNLPLVIGKGNMRIWKMSAPEEGQQAEFLPAAVFGIWDNPECTGDPYTVATSDSSGLVFKGLPIRSEEQKYYLKEMIPPDGYLLDKTVYTLTVGAKDSNGDYTFTVSGSDTSLGQNEGEPVIRNKHVEPIGISLKKIWQDADGTTIEPPTDVTSLDFTVERIRSYINSPLYTINLWIDDLSQVMDNINAYRGDKLTITYKHYPDSSGTIVSCGTRTGINNVLSLPTNATGSEISVTYIVNGEHANENAVIDILVPKTFVDWCAGENYQGLNPEFSGLESAEHETSSEPDPGYSETIILSRQNNWMDVLEGLPVQAKDPDSNISYQYEYYIQEDNVPAGFEVIYLDSDGKPVSDPVSLATNIDKSEFDVVNRKLLDIPLEKEWPDFNVGEYTWTATFQLEEMEEKVNDDDPDAPANEVKSDFTAIPGRVLTISKGETPPPVFTGLPMYRVKSNGTVYRIQYSVSEIGYTLKLNGTTVAQWGVNANGDELEVIGDTRYEPQFVQDAGEYGSTIGDYVIKILNVMENRILNKPISLTVQKTWPEGSPYAEDNNAYATFVLKRYVHQEFRDYHDVAAGTEWKTVTLETWGNDASKLQSVTVPVNTVVHISGRIKPNTNANPIRFTQDSGPEINLIQNNPADTPLPFDITVTADQDKTIHLAQGDNYVMGGRDGFRLSDTYGNKTQDVLDTAYERTFTLKKENSWIASFDLPYIEEQNIDPTTGSQTIYVYSYYLEETDCKPADFSPVFKDSNGTVVGDINNFIDYNTTLTAENKPLTTDITLKKVAEDQLDAANPQTLKGAAFRIEKYTSNTFETKDTSWGTDGEKELTEDNNNDGVFSIAGLTTGFYKIVETACPNGYLKLSEDPIFEVRLISTTDSATNITTKELKIILLNPDDKTDAANNQTEAVRVNDMTLLFGNPPGVELPETGGQGTELFTILGGMITAAAGAVLLRRRKRQAKKN